MRYGISGDSEWPIWTITGKHPTPMSSSEITSTRMDWSPVARKQPASETDRHPMFAYIDALRGYAILLVITSHLPYAYPELPYIVRQLSFIGMNGVQLFFLASCVTLMISWHGEMSRSGTADVGAFFIRRVFRIIPTYYIAGFIYLWFSPPEHGFEWLRFITTYGFINLWHPSTASTMGQWSVVPGGWSVTVEFTFYVMFPIVATMVTTLGRAMAFTVGAVAIAIVANSIGFMMWSGTYSPATIDGFLMFWFPNQLPVFALGTVVYFLMGPAERSIPSYLSTPLALMAMCGLFALNWTGIAMWTGENNRILGISLAAAVPFSLFVLALSRAPRRAGLFVNPVVAMIGRISFSAYLIHFAVIKLLPEGFPLFFHTDAGGVRGIAAFAAGWLAVTAVTCAAAFVTHELIEKPFIAAGRDLIRARRLRLRALEGHA